MYLNIATEFSFRRVFAPVEKILDKVAAAKVPFAGIADYANTFGHVVWQQECRKRNIKPIFGVVLPVYQHVLQGKEYRRIQNNLMTFIALNLEGLQEIYRLVDLAHQNFYYTPRIDFSHVNGLSSNVLLLSGHCPRYINYKNLYLQLSPNIKEGTISTFSIKNYIACCSNNFIDEGDRAVYEKFSDKRLTERRTTIQHIPTYQEWKKCFPGHLDGIKNLQHVNDKFIEDFDITPAKMIKIDSPKTIEELCLSGARARGLDIESKGKYKARYKRELKLIKEKEYVDYFLIVSDLVKYSKPKMVVGPARGSSAGSLICYLLFITEVDPLKYDLYFERFIDVNRKDLPDIDLDFADSRRYLAIDYLRKKYGTENVSQIGNISRLKGKSSILKFAKALEIHLGEVEEVKESIGDGSVIDTIKNTEQGKELILAYPEMEGVELIEGHADHSSIHAAGVIVSPDPITNFCGVNSRDKKQVVAMIDKRDAEIINLLKIDVLGLRTLTILSDICEQLGKDFSWLYDYIPLDDKRTYKTFNSNRYFGIFQFEGDSARKIASKMKIKTIDDISVVSALCRPGPLMSGGSNRYLKRRNKSSKIKYLDRSESFVNATKETFGVMVYQEQVIAVARQYAGLNWEDVSGFRKAISKSKGLDNFKKLFMTSCKKKGRSKKKAKKVWEDMKTNGAYLFNKSHSVSYAIISYLTAYFKTHYPLEFTVASLNHSKDDYSAVKFLRDMVENSSVEYVYYDAEKSIKEWCIIDGVLYGSLLSIDGIGPAAANRIIKCRNERLSLPMGIKKNLSICDTPFRYLYPATELYGSYYKKFKSMVTIDQIQEPGEYCFIGRLADMTIRDLNEPTLISKRGGERRSSPTTFLQLSIEDDTDLIKCSIWPEQYEAFGQVIAESGTKKDWYKIIGSISKESFRGINIIKIQEI